MSIIMESTTDLKSSELKIVRDTSKTWMLLINRNSPNKEYVNLMKNQILHNQGIVNRIKVIIKDKENEVEYMERQYQNIESESHNLHHEWKAKLDDIDMWKRLLL